MSLHIAERYCQYSGPVALSAFVRQLLQLVGLALYRHTHTHTAYTFTIHEIMHIEVVLMHEFVSHVL